QSLGKQAQALAVSPQRLQQVTTPSAKHEDLPIVRIALERLLYPVSMKDIEKIEAETNSHPRVDMPDQD
ncbi:MAG: hypothetical protein ACJ8F3_20995, partial [Xanthobacteraceae bacterium]